MFVFYCLLVVKEGKNQWTLTHQNMINEFLSCFLFVFFFFLVFTYWMKDKSSISTFARLLLYFTFRTPWVSATSARLHTSRLGLCVFVCVWVCGGCQARTNIPADSREPNYSERLTSKAAQQNKASVCNTRAVSSMAQFDSLWYGWNLCHV